VITGRHAVAVSAKVADSLTLPDRAAALAHPPRQLHHEAAGPQVRVARIVDGARDVLVERGLQAAGRGAVHQVERHSDLTETFQ
jgi:hypothetical protein